MVAASQSTHGKEQVHSSGSVRSHSAQGTFNCEPFNSLGGDSSGGLLVSERQEERRFIKAAKNTPCSSTDSTWAHLGP